ncbi:probable LRR receptor-like serine/threonine-protein kinase At1g67720 [Primulina eburnea]|uniref:probable LRR receptor-like serine/threonine-protein kinase At1g67720 n=1 Tax=Primulina eburnea TaxID=1245227 RepID=UPI003C6CC2C4
MYQSAMATLLSALALTTLLLITTPAHAGRRSWQKNSGEIFRLGVVSHATGTYTGKTNATDVLGLVYLFTQYPLLEEANGDPCFPPVWSWIECNSDPRPRVIALNLASRLLFETLPDFSMMDALESID